MGPTSKGREGRGREGGEGGEGRGKEKGKGREGKGEGERVPFALILPFDHCSIVYLKGQSILKKWLNHSQIEP